MIFTIIAILLSIIFYTLTFKLFKASFKFIFILLFLILFYAIISPFLPVFIQIGLSFLFSLGLAFYFKKYFSINTKTPTPFYLFPLIYIVVMTILPALIYYAFNYSMLDFGNMLQPIYNTAHGHFMELSRPWGNINRFSMHQEFIYLLFVPFIKIFPSGIVLIFFQTLAIGLTSFAIYKIAHLYFHRTISFLFAILFLLSPLITYVNLFSIHGDTFALLFISWSIYFYLKRNNSLFILFSVLSMMCKEYIAFIFVFFGMLMFLEKRYKLGIITLILSLFYYFVFIKFVKHFTGSSNFIEHMHYSNNIIQMIKNTFMGFKWENIILIFAMFLFIPVFRWKYLIPTLPIIAGIFLSKFSSVANIRTHHFATIYPFLFTATILFFKDIKHLKWLKINNILEFFFLFSIIFYFFVGGTSFNYRFYHPKEYYFFNNTKTYKITKFDKEVLKEIKKFDDPNIRISTTPNLASQLCMRQNINLLKWGNKKMLDASDFIIFTDKECFLTPDRKKRFYNDINYVRSNKNFLLIQKTPLEEFKRIN